MTAALLEGLRADPPSSWALWGPADVAGHSWPEAPHLVTEVPPLRLAGQRELIGVPPGRTIVYPHAVRPLTMWRRSVVLVHDIIPAHHGGSRVRRAAWRGFFRASALGAARVMVYSEATARRVVDELGVAPGKLRRIPLPINELMVQRIRRRRATGIRSAPPQMVYVGQFKPHKNLRRALLAFALSNFHAQGGGFTVIGPRLDQCADLRRMVEELGIDRVTIVPRCGDDRLVAEMAGAALLILPSLEEGFGLPVAESLAAGIPVCCSGEGALLEASRGFAETFDPRSCQSMAHAIDRAADLGGTDRWEHRVLEFDALDRPTALDLARAVRTVVSELR